MNLKLEQEQIEHDMNALGIERYHKNIRDAKNKSRESTTMYGVTLMGSMLFLMMP